ncbi:hypothetical protein ACH47B_09345 [Rhodococcus sp. NPDC019627]|uniref:hypothetical protein n=1 Tax=unclassified Rhodococcus (in: high G+C Gram-positive bacteria) TaxID=192944 RepID=UPI0033CE2950
MSKEELAMLDFAVKWPHSGDQQALVDAASAFSQEELAPFYRRREPERTRP